MKLIYLRKAPRSKEKGSGGSRTRKRKRERKGVTAAQAPASPTSPGAVWHLNYTSEFLPALLKRIVPFAPTRGQCCEESHRGDQFTCRSRGGALTAGWPNGSGGSGWGTNSVHCGFNSTNLLTPRSDHQEPSTKQERGEFSSLLFLWSNPNC